MHKKPRLVNYIQEVIKINDLQYPQLGEIPMGLGMALMQNKPAMDYYASLSEAAKNQVIEHTHTIRSKEEMQAYVDMLAKNRFL